jgi:hypothetical protein
MYPKRFSTNCPKFEAFVQQSIEQKKAIQAHFEVNTKEKAIQSFRFVKPI